MKQGISKFLIILAFILITIPTTSLNATSLNTYEVEVDGVLINVDGIPYENTEIELLVRTLQGNKIYSKTITTNMNGQYAFDEHFQFNMDTGINEADNFLEMVLIPKVEDYKGMEFLSTNASIYLNGADSYYADCALQPQLNSDYEKAAEIIIARTLQANNNAQGMLFTTTINNSILSIHPKDVEENNSINTYEFKLDGILQDTNNIPFSNTEIALVVRTLNAREVYSKTITTDALGGYAFDENFQFDMDMGINEADNFLEVVLIPKVEAIEGLTFLAMNASVFLNGADPYYANCAIQPEMHIAYEEVDEITIARTLQANDNAQGKTFTTTMWNTTLTITTIEAIPPIEPKPIDPPNPNIPEEKPIIVIPSVKGEDDMIIKFTKAIETIDTTQPLLWLRIAIISTSFIGLKRIKKEKKSS